MKNLIRQKLIDSLASQPPRVTLRDVHVPAVPGKAIAVIGPRRGGKTTFLWQLLAQRIETGTRREGLVYFNADMRIWLTELVLSIPNEE